MLSCNSLDLNSKDKIAAFQELNDLILTNHELIGWNSTIDDFKLKIPESTQLIEKLNAKYFLTEIQVHNLSDKADDIGIAYKLDRNKNKIYKFLLFTNDVNSKTDFESYEQFVECGTHKPLDEKWTMVTIADCFD